MLYIKDGEPLTRWSLSDPLADFSDPLVVSKTVGKKGNEHLRNEEKHVTSGGADLCACATQFPTPKKKKTTSQQWRASHTDSDVFNQYAKRSVKGKFEFEFSLALRYHQSY